MLTLLTFAPESSKIRTVLVWDFSTAINNGEIPSGMTLVHFAAGEPRGDWLDIHDQGPARHCSPCHGMPFDSRNEGLQSVDDVAGNICQALPGFVSS